MANRELFDLLPLFCKMFSRYPSNVPFKSSIRGSREAKHPMTLFSGVRTKKLAGDHLNRYFCKLDSPSPSNISFKSLLVRLQRQNTPLTNRLGVTKKLRPPRSLKRDFLFFIQNRIKFNRFFLPSNPRLFSSDLWL